MHTLLYNAIIFSCYMWPQAHKYCGQILIISGIDKKKKKYHTQL